MPLRFARYQKKHEIDCDCAPIDYGQATTRVAQSTDN
jgi:hypothetical protein